MVIALDREDDGRWIGEIAELPGVLAYGESAEAARRNAAVLAFRVIADRIEHGEEVPHEIQALVAA